LNISDAFMQATADALVLVQEHTLSVSDVAVIPKFDHSNIYEGLPPLLWALHVISATPKRKLISATPARTFESVTPVRELRLYS
jgi:hypothetical protein